MKFTYTITPDLLADYLDGGFDLKENLEVYVTATSFPPEPDVGVMQGGIEFDGWEWKQDPIVELEEAVERFFGENGEEIATRAMEDYDDYIEGLRHESD